MSYLEESNELLQALGQIKITNGLCFVVVENEARRIDATIVAGGCTFFYSDGSKYIDGPRPMSVRPGANVAFYSNDGAKCVKNVYVAVTVTAPGYKPGNITGEDSVGADECLTSTSFSLPDVDPFVSEKDFGTDDISKRLPALRAR